ncbi:MAG: hypothetical protein MJ248_01730 [Bacilli bacterium]|nr:hypothetical protein [Bacilli bacterium]
MNLKDLFNNKEYKKIIELTKDSKDSSELFICLSSYIQLNEYDLAVSLIEANRDILEKAMPYKLMQLHIELLLTKRDFNKAKVEAEHYQTLPYISQEVEEYLANLPNLIEEAKNFKSGESRLSYDEIDEVLTGSKDMGEVASVLFSLDEYNINKLIPTLDIVLVRPDVHPNLRTYALILLVQNNVNDTFQFLKNGKKLLVNPSKLNPPFNDVKFKEAFNSLNELNHKDPSLCNVSIQLFNNYILDTYPEDVLENEDLKTFVLAVTDLAKDYLSIPSENVDKKVGEIKDKIKAVLDQTPSLTF